MISRVVDQVKGTAGSYGQPVSNVMPSRHEEETGMGGGGTTMEPEPNDEF